MFETVFNVKTQFLLTMYARTLILIFDAAFICHRPRIQC